jgi:hypothetical protein
MLSGLPWGRSSLFRNRVLGQFLANRVTHVLNEMLTLDGTPQGVVNQSLISAFTGNCLVAGNDRRIEHDANALLRDSSTYGCLPFGTAYKAPAACQGKISCQIGACRNSIICAPNFKRRLGPDVR